MTLGDVLRLWDGGALGEAGELSSLSATPRFHPGRGGGDGGAGGFQHHSKSSHSLSKQRPVWGKGDTRGKQMNKQDQLWWGGDPGALLHDTDLKANCAQVELTRLD